MAESIFYCIFESPKQYIKVVMKKINSLITIHQLLHCLYLGFIIWGRSPEWPKATSFLGWSGNMLPRKFFEMNMLSDAIWYILRHNFEECSSVCIDLVASGWFFRYSYLYTVMITILLGGGRSCGRCVWDVSSWNVPQRRWLRRNVCRSQATLSTTLKFARSRS